MIVNEIIRVAFRAPTVCTVSPVSNPLVSLTGKVPCLHRIVAFDHYIIAHFLHPRIAWHRQIRTTDRCQ